MIPERKSGILKRFAIIGGGFYGCHFAMTLKSLGHDVVLFEKNTNIMSEASRWNQLRLHQGFHYPRSFSTRVQSMVGFELFLSKYPSLSREIKNNYYAVIDRESLIDSQSISAIFSAHNMPLSELSSEAVRAILPSGGMFFESNERLFLPTKAREFFLAQLGSEVRLNCEIQKPHIDDLLSDFDAILDCTYSGMTADVGQIHEATLILEINAKRELPFGALTLIDGPFWSIYPTEVKDVFTLSHVVYSPLFSGSSAIETLAEISSLSSNLIEERAELILKSVRRLYPDFDEFFSYVGNSWVQRKVKSGEASDARVTSIREERDRVYVVSSGKIDAALTLEREVVSLLGAQ